MNEKGDAPKQIKVLGDGAQQYVLDGVAAQVVWIATRYADFLNSPIVKGSITLNFSGRENSVNVVANITN